MKTKEKKGYNILLVEDDRFLVDMYTVKFLQNGHTIESTFSAKSALEKLRGGFVPDAIVTDLVMPEMNGFVFLETVHAEKLAENAAIIVLSNQSGTEDRERIIQIGIDEDIIKANATPSEVINIIEGVINTKKKNI